MHQIHGMHKCQNRSYAAEVLGQRGWGKFSQPKAPGSIAASISRVNCLGAESLLRKSHAQLAHCIRLLPLGKTHPRARHQPHSTCPARLVLGNQNHQARAAPGTHTFRVDWSCQNIMLPALACITKDAPANFKSPMAYTQALALLRWAIQLPWLPRSASQLNECEAQAYTLHSLKEALLVQLCSRDDTIESLWVQSQIASALIRGWRPTRPHVAASMQFSNPHSRWKLAQHPKVLRCMHCPQN